MAHDDDDKDDKNDKKEAEPAKAKDASKKNGADTAKKAETLETKPAKSEEKAPKDKDKEKDKDKDKPVEKKAAPASDKAVKKAASVKAEPKPEPKAVRKKSAEPLSPAAHAHEHAPNRREYWVIFAVLFVLTVLEVGVAQMPGISHTLMTIALISLALTKAACVGLFYMHLKHETKILKATVALPFAAPAVYALVLIAEAAWRLTR